MAWGKEAVTAELAVEKRENELLRERISELKEEIKELKHSLRYTQEALVAKESPEAYRDRKYEQDLAEAELNQKELTSEQIDQRKERAARADIAARYLHEMEKPLFTSAEDMIQQLTRSVGLPMVKTESLHGNSES